MPNRIYLVTSSNGNKALIDAGTPSQALRAVAKTLFQVKVASAREVGALVAEGYKIEPATTDEDGETPAKPARKASAKASA